MITASEWSAIEPLDHLAATIAAILFVGAVAFTVPVFVGRRRGQAPDAVRWADGSRREDAAAWGVDRVLRAARTSCVQAGFVFPGIVRCTVGVTIDLDLAAPTIGPPAPWTTTPDGRVWSTSMASLQAIGLDDTRGEDFAVVVALGTTVGAGQPADAGASAAAGVTAGATAGATVLADLRRAGGPIQLTGDADAVRAVARRIVDQLHTDPWSMTTPVLSVGLRSGDLGTTAPVSLADGIAAVRENSSPGLLVLASAPRGANATALSAALALPGNRWAVIVLGRVRHGRWSFDVSRDGTMSSPEFGDLRWADIALSAPIDTREPDEADEPPAGRDVRARRAPGLPAAYPDQRGRSDQRPRRDQRPRPDQRGRRDRTDRTSA
ncbi:hypothetical protein [Curtobacterium sp. Leaf261]|uniref:hypothetical protein n=1 Tax=Curtobacterium sp. Leaf261 TaxID=1736311 RepID=UPI0006FF5EDD|nr:hypothetical protein [Curtobacterium sp. Leaf261]KQO59959.1 hypothetical protein ASF23_15000 [Curtobacterium sp. Leaf261]